MGWITVSEGSKRYGVEDAAIRHWAHRECPAWGRRVQARIRNGVLKVWETDLAAAAAAHKAHDRPAVPEGWIAEEEVPRKFPTITIWQLRQWRPLDATRKPYRSNACRGQSAKRRTQTRYSQRATCPWLGRALEVRRYPLRRGERVVRHPFYLEAELKTIVEKIARAKDPRVRGEKVTDTKPRRPERVCIGGLDYLPAEQATALHGVRVNRRWWQVHCPPLGRKLATSKSRIPRKQHRGTMEERCYLESDIAAIAAKRAEAPARFASTVVMEKGEPFCPLPLASERTGIPVGTLRRLWIGEGPKWLQDRWNKAHPKRKLRRAKVRNQVTGPGRGNRRRWPKVRAIHEEDCQALHALIQQQAESGTGATAGVKYRNFDRNAWLYERVLSGEGYDAARIQMNRIAKDRDWGTLDDRQAVHLAIKRHCKQTGKPLPPPRKAGRK